MKDFYNKITGHFVLECINKDEKITDRYEDNNLIMDTARVNMCDIITGLSSGLNINKFVLGTKGHVDGDLISPKTSATGFVSSRTQLFSEESLDFFYPIQFTPANSEDAAATNIIETNVGSTVHILKSGSTVTYSIVVPVTAANSTGSVAYTEAALYAGSRIFSAKCFGAKVKDDTVSLRITWSISF